MLNANHSSLKWQLNACIFVTEAGKVGIKYSSRLHSLHHKKKHFIHINLHSVQTSVNNSDVCAVIRLLSHLWLSVVLNVWMNNVTLTCQLSVISCCMCRRMWPCLWHREALTDLMNWQMKRWGGFVIRKKKIPMQFDLLVITGEKITEQENQCHKKDTRSPTKHHQFFLYTVCILFTCVHIPNRAAHKQRCCITW